MRKEKKINQAKTDEHSKSGLRSQIYNPLNPRSEFNQEI
jgi:hypothetical protein